MAFMEEGFLGGIVAGAEDDASGWCVVGVCRR